ncbi:putative membrane protein [Ogataea parapolymorpha DL-1]|uniref:Dol-P-Glc:Glc(2)Man(9)GlcNAc(2)-PP-Dol alpha-1,2-glucosyltransferase n=1 Tax=Ogataea parapolymorpha (strain ATCC 26012 / BCRC 20466 / JCM 22074 / NRRL Y-7560 / DL-1) TaxID=871575 RepID=W1QI63_OGAPD|nr:putative membrane protein [Ogataea parapolymorpha DL-1]ESX01994.1 putative membrane protein [Ogataea parapolymorpha DL-1]
MDIVPEVALAAISVSIFKPYFDQANELVNYTFIDEIFHVNQVKEYWNGNFDSWDSKITTPPGLYYLALWWLKLTGLELSIANLRLLNFIGGVLLIITTLVVKKHHNSGLSAVSLFSSPLLTIYYTLFYTDVWSTLLIVQSYVAAVCWKPTLISATLSCLLGSISLLFRQTNIVWLAFALAVIVDKLAKDNYRDIAQYDVAVFVRKAFASWRIVCPFAMVLIAFINFVISNGGITMGDKENHVIVPHLAQVFYCFTFITSFSAPLWLSPAFIRGYFETLLARKYLVLNGFWIFIMFYIVQNFTFLHPFILADNRHYTFYIMRRVIFKTWYSKFLLLPVYHYSAYTVYKLFTKNHSKVLFIAFVTCVILTVAPSPLFEPRYFILPLVYWRLQVRPVADHSQLRLGLECLWNYWWSRSLFQIYFNYVFEWDDLPDPQRIIW